MTRNNSRCKLERTQTFVLLVCQALFRGREQGKGCTLSAEGNLLILGV